MKKQLTWVYFLLLLIFPITSYAYIEIGTGNILLQSLFGVAISLFVFYQQFCQFIKNCFKKLKGCKSCQEESDSNEPK